MKQSYILFIILICIGLPAQSEDLKISIVGQQCKATIAKETFKCSIGKSGITYDKTDGDNKTPIGDFPLREVYVRTDKISSADLTGVSLRTLALQRFDGWSEDPKSSEYNRWVDLTRFNPLMKHKKLYRKDDLYNIVIVAGHNDDPIVPGKGSVIFVRVASDDYDDTNGGIAFSQEDLLKILPLLNDHSRLIVEGPGVASSP